MLFGEKSSCPDIAKSMEHWYILPMKYPEITEEALALNEGERASLALRLMDTLSATAFDVSDKEAIRRDHELEKGSAAPLAQEDFVRRVQESRRNG
jgi:hypothetical protein